MVNTSFKQFRLYIDFFFTGSLYNSQRPEDFMLYNLEGTALLDEITSHIYIKDTRDIGALGSVGPSLVFVSIYHQDKRIERKLSLEVYDLRTQKIDTWLINRVSKFKNNELEKQAVLVDF